MTNVLKKINRAAIKFLQPLTFKETYKTIMNEAKKLVEAQFGSIFLLKEDKLERVYSSDKRLLKIVPRKRGYTYRAYKTNKAYVVEINDILKIHPEIRTLGVRSTIFIPLSYKDRSIGVLSLDSFERQHFTQKELNILELFGSLASLAIRKTQLYNKVQEALEARDLFISIASHEFKTPLTTIIAASQILERKLETMNIKEYKLSRLVSFEAFRLSRLVNELLELSQIKTGGLHFLKKEHNIKNIIEKAAKNFKLVYPKRKITVEDNTEKINYKIYCDFDKILQVIGNLLDNAVKFSSSESTITLSVNFDSPYYILSVKDTGAGIPEKELKYVFNSFFQVNVKKEGMGLGLFLAKKIIEDHQGSINIRSKLNKGTTVEIRLPKYGKK